MTGWAALAFVVIVAALAAVLWHDLERRADARTPAEPSFADQLDAADRDRSP